MAKYSICGEEYTFNPFSLMKLVQTLKKRLKNKIEKKFDKSILIKEWKKKKRRVKKSMDLGVG